MEFVKQGFRKLFNQAEVSQANQDNLNKRVKTLEEKVIAEEQHNLQIYKSTNLQSTIRTNCRTNQQSETTGRTTQPNKPTCNTKPGIQVNYATMVRTYPIYAREELTSLNVKRFH
jgi:hypothetical protein